MEHAGAVDYSMLREQYAEQKQKELDQEEGDLIQVTLKLPGDTTKQLKVCAPIATRPRGLRAAPKGWLASLLQADGTLCSVASCVQVKGGHQVEYLKAWLKEQPDVGERGVRLLYEGREMIDPLSFMDYSDIADAGTCTVTVEFL